MVQVEPAGPTCSARAAAARAGRPCLEASGVGWHGSQKTLVGGLRLAGGGACRWSWPKTFLHGEGAAVGIAIFNSVGALGGFCGAPLGILCVSTESAPAAMRVAHW